jgi:3-hydroxyisobutyrate dehydrogenase-like beta-hydroxyacid dehydrogenase
VNRSPGTGARAADTPADAARDTELVMYSLSNEEAVEEVVFGLRGILSGINESQIAIDMSTVLPTTSLREEKAYAKRGVDFFDVPVFGSKQESAVALGFGQENASALIKALEKDAGVEVKSRRAE